MPTWTELQKRNRDVERKGARANMDEVLVLDARARMTPEHFVEEKLRLALATDRRPLRRVPR